MPDAIPDVTIKRGDKGDTITLTVNMDLTDCTLRLLAQKLYLDPAPAVLELDVTPVNAATGVVKHVTTGTLEFGDYACELEATRGAEIFTFPTVGFFLIRVVADLG